MKLGLVLTVFTADPAKPLASAGRAAAAGYDAVFSSDHLFPPGCAGPSVARAVHAPRGDRGREARARCRGARHPGGVPSRSACWRNKRRRSTPSPVAAPCSGSGRVTRTAAPSTRRSGWTIRRSPSASPSWRRPCSRSGRSSRGGRGPAGGGPPRSPVRSCPPARRRSGSAARRRPRSASPPGRPTGGTPGGSMRRRSSPARRTWRGSPADAGRDPAEVPPTWAGIMLLGRDAKRARHARGGARGQRSRHGYLAGNRGRPPPAP